MTPFVPFPDGAQAKLHFDLGTGAIENRLWFLNRQPPTTQAQIDALAFGVASWYSFNLLPSLSHELALREVVAEAWDVAPPAISSTFPVGLSGSAGASAVSANVAVRVLFKGDSSQDYRLNYNFVPGMPVDQLLGNSYTPAFQDAVFEAYVALIDLAPLMGPFPAWEWRTTSSWSAGALRPVQRSARTDFILFSDDVVSPQRRRAHP